MMEVAMQLAEDLAPLEQSLYVELEELAEAKRRDKARCGPSGKGADIDCFARVEAAYPGKARTAANAFLGRAAAQYGALSERTRACLSRRETTIEGVQRSGLSGMFGMQAIASRAENWRMPAMLAETYGNLCGKAVEAAGRFGPPR
jgi:hypothetical protein